MIAVYSLNGMSKLQRISCNNEINVIYPKQMLYILRATL